MRTIKNLKAPAGYIYNGRMCLCGWEWARQKIKKADGELYNRLKIDSVAEGDQQRIYNTFCRQFQERWGRECPSELRED